ncbi:MAG: hypothetical protein ACFFC9_16115 [Promethearchaeota archaeon]
MINTVKAKEWRKIAFLSIIISPFQYIIFTAIAMGFYAGGTFINPNTIGYAFWQNFFSDLGRTIALSGRSNMISFLIFTISAFILTSSLVFFILAMPIFFKSDNLEFNLARINIMIGSIAGFFMFCVIFTPWNLFPTVHLTFSKLFSFTSLFVLILFSILIIKNENYPNIYGYTYLLIILFALVYSLIAIFGPGITTSNGLILQASAQKISQYSWLIGFMIQGYGSNKLLK